MYTHTHSLTLGVAIKFSELLYLAACHVALDLKMTKSFLCVFRLTQALISTL